MRLGRYGPFAQIGTQDDEEKPNSRACARARACTRSRWRTLWSCSSCRATWARRGGEDVSVGIGRFGPFVKQGSTYASLKPATIRTRSTARALELVARKAESPRNRLIKDFGNGAQILNGRYGPYITDGEKNARIPKDQEPSADRGRCAELLAAAPVARNAADDSPRRGKSAKTPEAAPAKKAAAKKATEEGRQRKKPAKKPLQRNPPRRRPQKKVAAKQAAAH